MAEFITVDEFVAKPKKPRVGNKGKRPRSDAQKPWDEALRAAFEDGRPMAVQVAPEAAEEARKAVASAARFHELSAVEGEPIPGKAEGTVILMWKVYIPKKRGPRNSGENPAE